MTQLVYITCSSADEARRIASILLDQQLIACANIFPEVTSYFRWEGQVQEAREAIVVAKSMAEHFEALETTVLAHHSYDCPCVVAMDITAGHAPFLQWLKDETGTAAG